MPERRLPLRVVVLSDSNNKPLANRRELQEVIDVADQAFRSVANLRIVPEGGGPSSIRMLPGAAPDFALEVGCDAAGYWETLTRRGRWFRRRSARALTGLFTATAPPTLFVVRNVIGKTACFLAITGSYGYIERASWTVNDRDSDVDQNGRRLTFAHELGHACDLSHVRRGLMKEGYRGRTSRLSRLQKAILRSSPRTRR
jgi:hypothetical protein